MVYVTADVAGEIEAPVYAILKMQKEIDAILQKHKLIARSDSTLSSIGYLTAVIPDGRSVKEVIREIGKVIDEEKEEALPNGRLLVTSFEVYFIKNGKIEWQGTVVQEPVKQGDRLYIASGEYVFCASVDGPVIWRKQITNEGKLQIRENSLVISAKGQETRLDLKTGAKL